MIAYITVALLFGYSVWKLLFKDDPLASIPGPQRVPVLGNFFSLDRNKPHHSMTKLAHQYGDIFKVSILGRNIVIVSGKDLLYELLIKKGNDFAGRERSFVRKVNFLGYSEVITGNFDQPGWHDLKKVSLAQLKGYGSGLKRLESITVDSIQDAIDKMKEANGKPINIMEDLEAVLVNITYTILFDRKLQNADERRQIMDVGRRMVSLTRPGMGNIWLNAFPWLRHFGVSAWRVMCKNADEKWILFQKWKEMAFDDKAQGKDVKANIVNRILKLKEEKLPNIIDENHLHATTWTLFFAGTLTTSGTLSALFHILADHPDLQRKLQEELDSVTVGRNVQIQDRNSMPFHQATILETLRMVPILPMLLPHNTMCNTTLGGHKIPAGITVLGNAWALHHNEEVFDDPYQFRPQRFLDEDGQLVPADHPNRVNLLTFGAGPRVCAGETFAISRMFLILAQMIKTFEILPPQDEYQAPFDCRKMADGGVLKAPDFKVCLRCRQ